MQVEKLNKLLRWWKTRKRWQQAFIIIVILLILLRPWISEWLSPQSSFRDGLNAAETALEKGELSRTDGKGAKELYEAILAVQPDQPDAREGLRLVLATSLQRANTAIVNKNYIEAEQMIQLAKSLSASSEQLQPLQIGLRNALRNDDGIQAWMQQALKAEKNEDYFSDQGALSLYNKILQVAPDYQAARDAREDLISELLKRQAKYLASGNLEAAQKELNLIAALDDTHYQLPEATAALSVAFEGREQWLEQRLDRAEQAMRSKKYLQAGNQYFEINRRIPSHELVREQLQKSALAVFEETERLLADLKLDEAEKNLQQLNLWGFYPQRLEQLQLRLQMARKNTVRAGNLAIKPEKLEKALDAAIEAKQWLQPPGESAWDFLRQIRLASKNEKQIHDSETLYVDRAWGCYQLSVKQNLLTDASYCLEALRLAVPNEKRIPDASKKLALLWRSWANDRINADEPQEARYATQQAARWDNKNPEQKILETRLNTMKSREE